MPADTALNDDDYVASLLTKSAAADNSRYHQTGLSSLFSQNTRRKDAPKPNTRFLKNLIRDTDSHNAALLAKEAEESKARLNGLIGAGQNGKRRRDDGDEGEQRQAVRRKRAGGQRPGRWADVLGGLGTRKERDRKHRERGPGVDATEKKRSTHSQNEEGKRPAERSNRRDNARRTRTRSRSRSPSAERERRRPRRLRERGHCRSLSPEGIQQSTPKQTLPYSEPVSRKANTRSSSKKRSTSDSDDPLESIVGPRPPPSSIPRGRGAHKPFSEGIDARFSSTYDPKADVAISSGDYDGERDDWDMALEALRDRAKWKQQGAERLRAAGFSEDEVAKWEHGDAGGTEKGVDDVRWRKKGNQREWDRGKVVKGDFVHSNVAWAK